MSSEHFCDNGKMLKQNEKRRFFYEFNFVNLLFPTKVTPTQGCQAPKNKKRPHLAISSFKKGQKDELCTAYKAKQKAVKKCQ
jgi:hypothetical protein